ncbi:MAG: DNA polymerase III subunit delta' [Pseudomonadota bacterium]
MSEPLPLVGHDDLVADFLGALRQNRMHHAWLLTGEQGIGKALFAHHAAALLLSPTLPSMMQETFRQALTLPAARQMLQGSHPDFRTLTPAEGKASGAITVEQVRGLSSLFQTTAGMGGWRAAIIDAADDMNRAAANAILKILEEPPPQSVFFLVSHAPGKLLPTIRSRCRQLSFQPLPHAELESVLTQAAPDALDDVAALLPFAQGSPGRALAYLDANALDYAAAIERLFESLPSIDQTSLLGLADQIGDRAGSPTFKICWQLLQDLSANAVFRSTQQAGTFQGIPTKAWLDFADGLSSTKAQIEALNLSPRQCLISLFSALANAKAA